MSYPPVLGPLPTLPNFLEMLNQDKPYPSVQSLFKLFGSKEQVQLRLVGQEVGGQGQAIPDRVSIESVPFWSSVVCVLHIHPTWEALNLLGSTRRCLRKRKNGAVLGEQQPPKGLKKQKNSYEPL